MLVGRTHLPPRKMALLLASSGLGFAPTAAVRAPVVSRAAAPAMGLESELGATGPLLPYWDPLGLGVNASPEKFARWRAVELKHGRISMLATVGYITQEVLRWPGYLSPTAGVKFSEIPNGIAGLKAVPPAGLVQILIGIGLIVIRSGSAEAARRLRPPLPAD